MTVRTWQVFGVVKRIVDGDTFVADLDLGWGIWRKESAGAPSRIRILHYDTPERGEADWGLANQILRDVLPLDSEVWLTSHALDSFGRALCDVYLGGKNILTLLPDKWKVP